MYTRPFKRLALAASIAALLAPVSTRAATVYWDGGAVDLAGNGDGQSQGGAGTWNTTLKNWDQGVDVYVAWPNTLIDEAVFGGTSGLVTLGSAVIANKLTFQVGGYTIAGIAANPLTLSGTTPAISVTNAIDTDTISAVVAGTAGLKKDGLGTLILSGTNTYTGGTTVSTGTLQIGADLNLGAAPVALTPGSLTLAGGTLATSASFTMSVNRGIALGVGGGTIAPAASTTLTYAGQIVGTTLLTKSGAGILVLSGTNNVTATGGIAITSGILSAGTNATLPSGGISINGGTLRLTATNTLAGAQVITIGAAGGTIDQSAATKLVIPAGFLTGSGTLTRTASGANVVVGGTGVANIVSITGANPGFTGAVTLAGGQMEVSANGLGNGLTAGNTITINSGAELTASNSTLPNALIINAGANIGGDNGTSTFSGPITVNGAFRIRLGDFYQATNRNLNISGPISGTGAITFLNSNTNTVPTTGAGQILSLSGDNSGYTSNISIPAGFTVAFAAANSVGSGGVTVNSSATGLGVAGFGYDFGATLPTITNTRTGTTTGGVFAVNSVLAASTTLDLATLGGGGMFLGSTSTGTYAASTLGADNGTYRLGGGVGTLTLSGTNVLTGTAAVIAGDTRISGTGTVVLTAANDYTGTTTINGGTTLQISNGSALGSAAAASGTIVTAGGSLALSGGIVVNEPLSVTGTSATASTTNLVNGLVSVIGTNTYAGTIDAATGSQNARISVTAGTLNLPGNIILSGGGILTGLVFAGAGTISQTGVLSGDGSVFVTSTGAVTPSTLNTYTGLTQFQNGTATYNVASFNSVNGGTPLLASSSLGAPVTVAAGTLQFGTTTTAGALTYVGTGETTDRVINLNGTTGGATITNNGTGLLKFTSDATATGAGIKTFTLQGSGTGEISGIIPNNSGTNLTSVTKSNSGTWRLTGANTYAGATVVNQGTLVIDTLTALSGGASSLGNPTTVANGTIALGSSAGSAVLSYVGTGSVSDRNINLAGATNGATLDMAGTGTFQVGAVTATGGGIKTLALTGSTSGEGIISGAIANNSATNTTAVTKGGTGTWNLGGANTYTGATTINAGLLRINGNATLATGAVAVNTAGSLGGTGTIGGAVAVAANGNIDLRDGVTGTLKLLSTLTFNGTATTQNALRFDLGSNGANSVDSITATGAITAATANSVLVTFNQLAGTPLADGTYPLLSSNAVSNTSGLTLATTRSGGHTYSLVAGTAPVLLQVLVGTAAAGPATPTWGGTVSNSWTDAGNWYGDASGGIVAGAIPGVGSNVTFYTNNPTAINLGTTLNADFEINSLSFPITATTPVTIAGTANALVIDAVAAIGINQQAAVTHTISSRVGLGGAQTWTVGNGGTLLVSGLVFDTGSGFTLTKDGAGTLNLSGTANTFTGDINVTAGVLAFAGNSGTSGDPLSLGAGNKTITITNNAVIRPTSTANPTSTNTKRFVVGAGGATFDVPNGVQFSLDDAGQFSGTGDLTVTGAGTGFVFLNNQAHNFSGNVTINSGALRLGTNSVLGTAPGRTITVNAAGTLDASAALTTTTIPLAIVLNGGTISASSASASYAQAVSLTANSVASAGTSGSALFTETLSGNLTGAFSLTKNGGGTTVLSGTNSYGPASGATTIITAGILQAAKRDALPNYATAGQVTVASGATLALNVGGAGEFDAADVTNFLSNGTFLSSGSGIGFDTTNAAGGTFSAPAIAPGFAVFNLTKLGTGTLVLPAATGLGTGTTRVFNGTLSVANGAATNPLGTGALTLGTYNGVPGNLDLGTSNQTVSTVTAQSNSATANTVTIGDGNTLTVTGVVTIGAPAATATTKLNVVGANGTFSIGTATTATNANVLIGANVTDALSNAATLDLSGLGTFYANLGTGTLRVGDATNASGTATLDSTLILAGTSTIRATTVTSDSPDSGRTETIRLGSGSNTINANTIEIGGSASGRANGVLNFNTTTGTLTVRNLAGTGRANLNVAYGATATGAAPIGTVNLNGHSADLMLGTLQIGGRTATSAGSSTGTFSFDMGTLDVTGIVLARRAVTATTAGTSTGTLNLGGGTVIVGAAGLVVANNTATLAGDPAIGTVNISGGAVTVGQTGGTSITLGSSVSANGPATATLAITGGSLTVAGNIVKGTTTGTVTSTLTLNGATAVLDLAGKVIGAAGAGAIDNVNIQAGTLRNVAEINSGAGLTKTTAGIVLLEGSNTYTGGTFDNAGTLLVSGSLNGSVNVASDATFGGAGTVFTGPAGVVTIQDRGVVAPGPDVTTTSGLGTLTIDAQGHTGPALSLLSGATFSMQLSTGVTPSDTIALTHASAGNVVFANNVINFSDLSAGQLASTTYTLFTADAAGAFSGLTTDGSGFITAGLSIGSGLGAYPIAALQVVGNNIVLTNIPEPGSATMLFAGLASLLGLQRFRRRAAGQPRA